MFLALSTIPDVANAVAATKVLWHLSSDGRRGLAEGVVEKPEHALPNSLKQVDPLPPVSAIAEAEQPIPISLERVEVVPLMYNPAEQQGSAAGSEYIAQRWWSQGHEQRLPRWNPRLWQGTGTGNGHDLPNQQWRYPGYPSAEGAYPRERPSDTRGPDATDGWSSWGRAGPPRGRTPPGWIHGGSSDQLPPGPPVFPPRPPRPPKPFLPYPAAAPILPFPAVQPIVVNYNIQHFHTSYVKHDDQRWSKQVDRSTHPSEHTWPFVSDEGYLLLPRGRCSDIGCDDLSEAAECEYAAAQLPLPELLPVRQVEKYKAPGGCYVKPQGNTL
eukprot:g45436.t1